ncbi:MAG: YfaZ family protein [Bacteroidota bacterium]|nr:YfaZ family protein [Bacteroidota bacterium]
MKRFLLCLLALTFSAPVFSQDLQRPVSNIFLELGGNAGVLSLNYDRRFSKTNSGFGWRVGVGLGAVPSHIMASFIPTFPLGINYLLGKGSHHLEVGAGVTLANEDFSPSGERIASKYFVPSVGYRFQRLKGFSFRVFFSPFLGKKNELSAGLSLGASF